MADEFGSLGTEFTNLTNLGSTSPDVTAPIDYSKYTLGTGFPAENLTGMGAASSGDSSSWWDKNKSWLGTSATLGLPIAALGTAGMVGSKGLPYQSQLTGSATDLLTQGKQLTAPLISGAPLPTGAEATVQGGAQAAKAAILSNAAATGQLGTSSTQQALQAADLAAQQQRFQIANTMYTQGVQDIAMGDTALMRIGQQQLAQDQMLSNALAGVAKMFASTDAGGLLKGLFS